MVEAGFAEKAPKDFFSSLNKLVAKYKGGEFSGSKGFQWSEDAEISDESVIRQVSHEFVGPGIDKPPGTPGKEVWTFKALKKGTVTTLLEYSRPWVEEEIGYWTVTITTTIK